MIKIFHLPILYIHQQGCKRKKKILLLSLIIQVLLLPAMGQNITRPNIQGPSGLQVNSFTGSLFYQRTDLFVPGRGLSLNISFTYNSSDRAADQGYGYGWTFHYNRFYTATDTSITFYNSDGRRDVYKKDGINFIAPAGIFDRVINHSAGKFKLVTKDGTAYYFDDATHKKLTKIVERNNKQLSLSYSGGLLNSIADASGRTVTFNWTNNKLTQVKADFSGAVKTIDYAYDPAGTLKSVRDPLGNTISYTYIRSRLMGSLTDGNNNTTNILYSSNSAVTKLVSCEAEKSISYNAAELKTYSTDRNSENTFVTTYTFNAAGNLISKSGNCCGYNTTYSYDGDNNINQVKDANGHITVYTYDSRGNLISETDPLNQSILYTYESTFSRVTSITDKRGSKTEYAYDDRGNLLQIKKPLNTITTCTYDGNGDRLAVTDPRGNKTTLSYNAYGYPVTIKDALNGVTTLSYDVWGNRLSQKDANNHTSTFVYDVLNRVKSATGALANVNTYSYDANGNLLSAKDANNNSTNYIYNSRNNPLIITDAAGNSTIMQYDAVGNMMSFRDAKGNKTSYTYDKQSRRVSEINAAGDYRYDSYDGIGNKTGITYTNGNLVTVEYDAIDRVTKITDKIGTIATYQYDANNNKIAEADANGNTTTYTYDELNRLITKTDPLGNAYSYTYNSNGSLITLKDREGSINNYEYDAVSRMSKMTDAKGYATIYTYDAVGNTLSITDAKGNVTAYTYDALNRNIQETFADNTTKQYSYDVTGNLISRRDNAGQVTGFTYDNLNRLIARSYSFSTDSFSYDPVGQMLKAKNAAALVSFSYDNTGRLTSETLNGRTTAYAYNTSAGIKIITYPSGKTVKRSTDIRDELTTIEVNGKNILELTYNVNGYIKGKKFGNSIQTNYTYNSNQNIAGFVVNPNRIVDIGYTYDKEENPLAAKFNHRSAISEQYSYDKLNQLTAFTKGIQQSSFNYDGVGNRTTAQLEGITATYTVNSMNAYTGIVQGTPVNLSHDANGNQTNDGTRTFNYDHENRLIAVNSGTIASYLYDALGRRIQKNLISDTIKYFFDGPQVINEYHSTDSNVAMYVWGTWVDDIVLMQRNGHTYYYHTNSLGSVMAVTDSIGNVAERYEYDAFGKVSIYSTDYRLLTSSIIGNNYTYTGREFEKETGNYYYRSRYYNSSQGHFLQRDLFGYGDGMNPYSYVRNMPSVMIDPYGMWGIDRCKLLDYIQTILDIVGLIPGIGEPADLLNALIYGYRGDYVNAALSSAAAVPFIGWGASGAKLTNKVSGSYLLEFQSGKFYAGKGLESRMNQSINRIEKTYGDKLSNSQFFPASSTREAFINEHNLMMQYGGPLSFNPLSPTYNQIFSPGKKLGGF